MPTNHRAEDFVHHRIPTPAPEWQRDAAGGTSIPHFRFELIEPCSSPPPRRKRAPIRSAWNLRAVALRELVGLAPSARSGLRKVEAHPWASLRPSNAFSILTPQLDAHTGAATLRFLLAGPGLLRGLAAATTSVGASSARAAGAPPDCGHKHSPKFR